MKLIQEAGELSDSLCKNKDIRDDIGDMMVVGFRMGKTVLQVLQVGKDSAFQVDKGLGKILLFMLIQRLPRLFGNGNGWFSLVCF